MLITRGFGQHMNPRINLCHQAPEIDGRKGGDILLKINPLSTLYVGIDVSSKSNVVCTMDFYRNKYVESSFANNQPGTDELIQKILECLKEHPDLHTVVAALESTSVYSIHVANSLSSCEALLKFKTYVFVLNPKTTANYKSPLSVLVKRIPSMRSLLLIMQEPDALRLSPGEAVSS